jgi:hypothetical protein
MTASWDTAHNIKLSGIEANGRKVILYHNTDNFQTPTCSDQDIIATLSKDGCSVIPGDVSVFRSQCYKVDTGILTPLCRLLLMPSR